MAHSLYEQIALKWQPSHTNNTLFKIVTGITLSLSILLAIILSNINVPKPDRLTRVAVPERVAKFILEKEKPKPKIVKPKIIPKVKPKPKPTTKKIVKKKIKRKALTKKNIKDREVAEKSGLLALSNDLADLMDTSDVNELFSGSVKSTSKTSTRAATLNNNLLIADAGKGSGGVNSQEYTTSIGKTHLSQRTLTQVKQSLLTPKQEAISKKKVLAKKGKKSSIGVRAEEDITLVFDQNKSQLYSLYNRARRKNLGLKGKIVLSITIAPTGKIIKASIISSELDDKKLERRILNRIKLFKFGKKKVKQITVTYPIEFLPS